MAKDPDLIEDEDNPEWTDEDFAQARPFKDVFPEQYAAWKRAGGMTVNAPKTDITLHLAADVVEAIRASGSDYDSRVEQVLRKALAAGEF